MIDISKIQKEKPLQELIKFSIINIDKPSGPTSFQVSQFLKEKLKVSKAAHLGTLDPQVSGVLPTAVGRACKLSDYFMHKNKMYVGIMRVHNEVKKADLQKTIKKFIGKIKQLPPIKSRVKRAIRERQIFSFKILEISGKDILFETEVQAGTYIRKLIHDLGEEIGGAHMLELRRTKAGIFSEPAITLYDFEKALKSERELRKILIPAEVISKVLPVVQFNGNPEKILTGKPLMRSDVKKIEHERFSLFQDQKLLAIMKTVKEGDIIARPEFVLN